MRALNRAKKSNFIFFSVLISTFAMLSFQNCGKGFESATLGGGSDLSSLTGPNPLAPLTIPILTPQAGRLSETSFFYQVYKPNISNFKRFEPQFALFSDNATKKRWIYLPPGDQINTQNLDEWTFPKGTILWKEFSIDGRKVETRVLEKIGDGNGPANWRPSVYLWRTDQLDADLLTVEDFYTNPIPAQDIYEARAVQSRYRIVNTSTCMNCHRGATDVSLGFNYLQLSTNKIVNVNTLKDEQKLSHPPNTLDELRGTAEQKAGIGYIQANCAHCHNGRSGAPHNFRHISSVTSFAGEPLVMSASASAGLVTTGDPSTSRLMNRFLGAPLTVGGPASGKMPPIGVSIIDPVGERAIGDLIRGFND